MDKNKLNTLLILHVQSSFMSYQDILDINSFTKETCLYSGEAYRIIPYDGKTVEDVENPNLKFENNLFWSKDINGALHYNSIRMLKKYHLLKTNIVGLDVNKLFLFLNSQFPDKHPRTNRHEAENEVLYISSDEIKIFKTPKFGKVFC